jgi:hypothetical protein
MRTRAGLATMILLLCASLSALAATQITRSVMGTGGGRVATGTRLVAGTVGQAVVGTSMGPAHTIQHGFWAGIGGTVVAVPEPDPGPAPRVALLRQNAPNPFHAGTEIRFALPADTQGAELRIFDLEGRLVRAYPFPAGFAGEGSVRWNGKDKTGHAVASGIYLYVLETPERRLVRKMTLVR